jgi:hypothetical protein
MMEKPIRLIQKLGNSATTHPEALFRGPTAPASDTQTYYTCTWFSVQAMGDKINKWIARIHGAS